MVNRGDSDGILYVFNDVPLGVTLIRSDNFLMFLYFLAFWIDVPQFAI